MTQSVLLILSAQYCNPELQAEFGAKLPACAVPIGPQTLVSLQIETAFKNNPNLKAVFLGLPIESLDITQSILERWGDKVIFVEPIAPVSIEDTFNHLMKAFINWEENTFPLGRISTSPWCVTVLNGDTLITDKTAYQLAGAVYSSTNTPFEWSKEQKGQKGHLAYAGMTTFRWSADSKDGKFDYVSVVNDAEVIRIQPEQWLDFGHGATYYRSKRSLLSTRAANSINLSESKNLIEKVGNCVKIQAEIAWYRNLPESVAIHTPRIYYSGRNNKSYTMEYRPAPSLAELLVHGNHNYMFWDNVMERISDLLLQMRVAAVSYDGEGIKDGLLLRKTEERTSGFKGRYREHVDELMMFMAPFQTNNVSIVHGDLCFSNILYDARSDSITMIDPRGPSIYGDQLYDIAKLYHSVHGRYDFIMAQRESREDQDKVLKYLSDHIVAYAEKQCGATKKQLTATTALLFYSMLPLHMEDEARVMRLLSRAESLYCEWENMK